MTAADLPGRCRAGQTGGCDMNWHEALAQRVELLGRSEVMAIMKLAERSDIISFAGGLPHADTFLIDEFRATALEVLDGAGRDALGYSHEK